MFYIVLSAALFILYLIADYCTSLFDSGEWIRFAIAFFAFAPVGIPVIIAAVKSSLKGDCFTEFTLMSLASIGAFAIGEYPEAVAVMLLYSVGE